MMVIKVKQHLKTNTTMEDAIQAVQEVVSTTNVNSSYVFCWSYTCVKEKLDEIFLVQLSDTVVDPKTHKRWK